MTVVRDQAARDRVRDDHDVSLFVEAGAGTGKTSALVARVVALVTAGTVELRHLAAITFTEAAAAELRDRVRGELEQVAANTALDESERDRSRAALDQLDESALTTLHGFAHRLLSEHPFDVGLPPGFGVLEAIEASVEFEQRWGELVDELFADPELEPALTTWIAGRQTVAGLRPIAFELCTHHDRLAPPAAPPAVPAPRAAALLAALEELAALRRDRCRDDEDLLAVHLDSLLPYRDALAAARDELDVLEAVYSVPELKCSRGKAPCWDGVEGVRTACVKAEELRTAVIDEPRRAALAVLAGRLTEFARRFADDRRREGRLWFHDLLVLARDLLRDHPEARAAAAARYRRLLIDEFQDTDPLQIELAVLLAADDADLAARHWSEATIRPGALTLVGDPKQAVYRFRDADLRVYHEARAELGLEPVALVENFRSAAAILDTVNDVFAALLEEKPGVQAAHVPLLAHRQVTGPTRVAVLGGAQDAPIVAVREAEADDVAATVRQIVEEGWPVDDPKVGVRPAVERDIALLIPSRTVLPALEAALERAGVPVRVESQSLVYATAEVRDLLHVLAAVDDPTDEIAVVAALRSPGFGCSDADLVRHVEGGGGWDYRRDPPGDPDDDPVASGLRALRRFWEQRWWRPVSGTVEAVVRERRLLELASRHRRPRDHWRRLRFLLDEARAWDDAGETSLRGFVDWARRQAEQGARVNESVAPEPDDPALRILTVHGAKGLEFPIVVLAGLNTAPPNQPPAVVWGPSGPALRAGTVSRGLVTTSDYDERRKLEREHDDAERLRLLYVAMTRARDHLVVSLHHKERTRTCHAARLAPRLASVPVLHPARRAAASAPPAEPVPTSALPAIREAWIEQRGAALARAGAPASIAATTLAEAETVEVEDSVDARPPWQRGRAGTAIGRAVHAVLQTVELETGAGLEATARAQALAEGVAAREAEVRSLVESVLASPTVRAITEGRWPRWREVPVATEVDGVLLEGFIDLLARTPDGLLVVDYKTDAAPTDADLDAAVARYTIQGAAYALALEATLGEPVQGCVFVFARATGAVERVVEDLPAAVSAVRARLAGAPA